MYGSYHRISTHTADGNLRAGAKRPSVVAGPSCESGDVFTQEGGVVTHQDLPICEVGVLLCSMMQVPTALACRRITIRGL
jgi:diaminopimelate decarboxylase